MSKLLAPIMAAAGPLAAAGLVAGFGVAALKIGEAFEGSFHRITELTGKTGDELEGLKHNFDDVFSSTPGANFKNVADALGLVEVRTGLTGAGLEDLSQKFIELSKITKTDVSADITAATSVFNLFSVAVSDQSGELDVLYKAARLAGVGFGEFASTMTGVIPTAQSLGLSIDQTAAITSNLTKLGLPAGKVMLALGKEFSAAAKAGEEPTKVIADMIDQIQRAPDATAATTLAIKDFGLSARSASTFVTSVRQGTFDFGETLKEITDGKGGINDTTQATLTLGDKFGLLKNKALVGLEPIGEKALDIANIFMDKIPVAVAYLQDKFTTAFALVKLVWADLVIGFENPGEKISGSVDTMTGAFKRMGEVAGKVWDAVWPVVEDRVIPLFHTISDFISDHLSVVFAVLATAVGLAVAPVVTLTTGMFVLYQTFEPVRTVVDGLAAGIETLAKAWTDTVPILTYIGIIAAAILIPVGATAGVFVAVGAAVATAGILIYEAYQHSGPFRDLMDDIGRIVRDVVWPALKNIPSALSDLWSAFLANPDVQGVFDAIRSAVTTFGDVVQAKVLPAIQQLWEKFQPLWHTIVDDLKPVVQWMTDHWQIFAGALLVVVAPVAAVVAGFVVLYEKFSFVRDVVGLVVDALKPLLEAIANIAGTALADAIKMIGGFVDVLTGLFSLDFSKVGKGLGEIASAVLDNFANIGKQLGGLLLKELKLAFSFVVTNGPGLLEGIGKFFISLPGRLLGFLGDLGGKLAGWVGDAFSSLAANLPGFLGYVTGFFLALPVKLIMMMGEANIWLLKKGIEIINGLLLGLWNALPGIADFILHLPTNLQTWAKDAALWLIDKGKDIVVGLAKGLWDSLPAIGDFIVSLPGKIGEFAIDADTWLSDLGRRILQSLLDGVVAALGGIGDIVGKIKDGFMSALGDVFNFGSPSKVMFQRGQWIVEGMANGINENAHLVDQALGRLGANAPGDRPGTGSNPAPRGGLGALPRPGGPSGLAGAGGPDKLDKTNALLEALLGVTKTKGLGQLGATPDGCYTDAQIEGQTKVVHKMRTLSSTRQR